MWAKGACTPKNVNFKSMGGADVRWRQRLNARRGSGKEGAPICGGGGDRNAATRPALPRLPGRTSGAALAPTRRLCRLRGLVRARKPTRDPPSSPLPLPRRRPSAPPPPHRSSQSARGLPSWARSAPLYIPGIVCHVSYEERRVGGTQVPGHDGGEGLSKDTNGLSKPSAAPAPDPRDTQPESSATATASSRESSLPPPPTSYLSATPGPAMVLSREITRRAPAHAGGGSTCCSPDLIHWLLELPPLLPVARSFFLKCFILPLFSPVHRVLPS